MYVKKRRFTKICSQWYLKSEIQIHKKLFDPTKRKKSAIREVILPRKFHATQYILKQWMALLAHSDWLLKLRIASAIHPQVICE